MTCGTLPNSQCVPHVGDPDKVVQPTTTNRATFQPPQPSTSRSSYSRSAAISATLASSVHLGGTPQLNTFSTTVGETFSCPVNQADRTREHIKRVPRNASFLPCGDLDVSRVKERMSLSTTRNTQRVVSHVLSPCVYCGV